MKKIAAILVCLLAFCSACASAEVLQDALYSGDYAYIVLDNGTAEIVNYLGTDEMHELTIPASLDGIVVTQIGDKAFSACQASSISIPEGVKSIGRSAFSYCDWLKAITIPSSVETMAPYAFYMNLNLTSVNIADGAKAIGDYAFDSCYWLESFDIPASVEFVGVNPFQACRKMTAINVSPESAALESIDGVLFNKAEKKLISYPQGLTADSYTVPDGTVSIAQHAFFDCALIKTVTLPSTLKTIEAEAFVFCDALEEVIVPDGVETIESAAFGACSNLKSLHLPQSVSAIGDYAFQSCSEELTFTVPAGSYVADYVEANGFAFTNP